MFLLLLLVAAPLRADDAPKVRVYENRLTPIKDAAPLLADHPAYVEPIKTGPRFEAPVLIDDAGADLDQLYAREDGHRGRDAVLLRGRRAVATVIDRPWQADDPGHLERAASVTGRVMLAGGLSPENVREAVETVRPWAVDASSSLEVEPGVKDHARVRAFVEAAR